MFILQLKLLSNLKLCLLTLTLPLKTNLNWNVKVLWFWVLSNGQLNYLLQLVSKKMKSFHDKKLENRFYCKIIHIFLLNFSFCKISVNSIFSILLVLSEICILYILFFPNNTKYCCWTIIAEQFLAWIFFKWPTLQGNRGILASKTQSNYGSVKICISVLNKVWWL